MEREIKLDIRKTATIKIGLDNKIIYANDYMLNVLGYSLTEFIGNRPKIVCHPDMPDIIHDTIGQMIMKYQSGIAVLKHATKHGDYLWAFTHFKPSYREDGTFEAFITRRKPLPDKKINGTEENLYEKITKLYHVLKQIEQHSGVEQAMKYLDGFLEDRGYENLHQYYMSFFDFKQDELEAYFQINQETPTSKIKKYFDPKFLSFF